MSLLILNPCTVVLFLIYNYSTIASKVSPLPSLDILQNYEQTTINVVFDMRQAEAGTEVAESSWCPTPAHTPSHGQADIQIQTHCSLMIYVLKDLSPTLIRLEHMYFVFLPLIFTFFLEFCKAYVQ
jgi:hypothetical protein